MNRCALFAIVLFLPVLVASQAAAQVIHACIKSNGTISIVSGPADCSPRETPISWNQVGPQGDPGADGVPGPEGQPGTSLRVFDANDNVLGIPTHKTSVFFNEDISLSFTKLTASGVGIVPTYYFELPGCLGQAYAEWSNRDVAGHLLPRPENIPWLSDFFVGGTVIEPPTTMVQSFGGPGAAQGCETTENQQPNTFVRVEPFVGDLPSWFPATAPFHIGSAPE